MRFKQGVSWYQIGDFEKAAESFAQALRLDPEDADSRYNLARTLAELRLYNDAVKQLMPLIQDAGDDEKTQRSRREALDLKRLIDARAGAETATESGE